MNSLLLHRLVRATLPGVALFTALLSLLAAPVRAALPPDRIFADDTFMNDYISELNKELIKRGADPYNRSSIPAGVLTEAKIEASRTVAGKSLPIISEVSWFTAPATAARDFLATDSAALVPTATGGTATIIGYGQAPNGFNYRAFLASTEIYTRERPPSPTVTVQAATGFPANATDTFLTGIAADGSVATGYYRPTLITGFPFFLPFPNGVPTALPLASGDLRATPQRVSHDGSVIIGTSFQTSTDTRVVNDNSRIIRWNRTGSNYAATTLGGFPGAFRTVANSISADGAAVVGYYLDAQFSSRPIRWTQSTGFQELGALPGQTNGQAIGANNDGSIIVGTSGQAFTWTPAGNMNALRALAGSGVSSANAVTPSGSLIGGASYDGGFANPIAQLWTKTGETIKLRDLLFVFGVDVGGTTTFKSVDRITTNSVGDYVILGNGTLNGVNAGYAFTWKHPAGPPPVIITQPKDQTAAIGGSAVFNVGATGATNYAWYREDKPRLLVSRGDSTLRLGQLKAADAGDYSVDVSNADGSVTSRIAKLIVQPTVSRLSNLSVRGIAGTGTNTLTVGMTIAGGSKQTVQRGIGPALFQFNVTGALADTQMALYNSTGVQIDQNNDWDPTATPNSLFDRLGAFRLPGLSKDAALIRTLDNGSYTTQVSGAAGTSGVALVEIYDADEGSPAARFTNLSARNFAGTGDNKLIVGFNVEGNAPMDLLLRGIGPALAQSFGIAGALADSHLAVYNSAGAQINQNDDWDAALTPTFDSVGAFRLLNGSKDAALSVTLPPGSYTVQLSGVNNTTGVGLIELYELRRAFPF